MILLYMTFFVSLGLLDQTAGFDSTFEPEDKPIRIHQSGARKAGHQAEERTRVPA